MDKTEREALAPTTGEGLCLAPGRLRADKNLLEVLTTGTEGGARFPVSEDRISRGV